MLNAAQSSDRARSPRLRSRWLLGLLPLLALAALAREIWIHPSMLPHAWAVKVADLSGANPDPQTLRLPPEQALSAVARLGRQVFYDRHLSASGRQSCASCHSPDHAYGPADQASAAHGGPDLQAMGQRAVPSLDYLYRQSPFSIGPDPAENDSQPISMSQLAEQQRGAAHTAKTAGISTATAMVPQGGLFWDGRADSLQRQATGPLFNPIEMANHSAAEVAAKLDHSSYRQQFVQLFGPQILQMPASLVDEAMFAVARYQFEEHDFHRFDSKYDAWLQGKARLSAAELRGLKLFNDPSRANCAGCHVSQVSPDHLPPLFTDTQYEALSVPRNNALPINHDASYHDLGVCGPVRKDMAGQTQYCGMFLTPTLRNTASRGVYFHNGIYHSLREVMRFYNLRSVDPGQIYPRNKDGHLQINNDIPRAYWSNIDTTDAPFNRRPGQAPAMTDADINDIIAFLGTLDDGYRDR